MSPASSVVELVQLLGPPAPPVMSGPSDVSPAESSLIIVVVHAVVDPLLAHESFQVISGMYESADVCVPAALLVQ